MNQPLPDPHDRLEPKVTRREFLDSCWRLGWGLCASGVFARELLAAAPRSGLKEAMFYRRLSGKRTQCLLCPNQCVRRPGEAGMCRARGNRTGRYYSLVHGRPCVVALDKVEKCPLNHFQIGGDAFSIATAGCNLSCHYCQNWEFSQVGPDEASRKYDLTPAAVVDKAVENRAKAIAYFYTEPTVYYEYMLDVAKLARKRGLKNVMVTAGYISPEPLREALRHLDAVTLGLKGWNERFYREYIGGELSDVKQTLQILAAQKRVWWEVVTLIVPSLNDDLTELAAMAAWLKKVAGAERPLHFTRFRPEYKLKHLPMTPAATLTKAREVAIAQGLKHVYVGNLPGHAGANTYCPGCNKLVVERLAFKVLTQKIKQGKCEHCGRKIGGLWR